MFQRSSHDSISPRASGAWTLGKGIANRWSFTKTSEKMVPSENWLPTYKFAARADAQLVKSDTASPKQHCENFIIQVQHLGFLLYAVSPSPRICRGVNFRFHPHFSKSFPLSAGLPFTGLARTTMPPSKRT